MENKLLLIKIIILGMLDGIFTPTISASLDVMVKIFQIVFYAIGAYVLWTSARDAYIKKKKERNDEKI